MSKNTQTNTRRRIIAIILAIMMLLSVMPTTALAAEGDVAQIGDTAYSDLKAALDDAVKTENEGCTVTLLANATLTSEYSVTAGKFTLDLNGKKINGANNGFNCGGDVTIIDSVGGGIISSWYALTAIRGHLTLGKADGTANNFTIQGEGCSLYCRAPFVTIYGGTYIAGSTASIWEDSQHYANEVLGEGLAFAKKDDPTSVVDGNVSTLTESVTVVSHTHSYVDGECACGVTDPGVAQIGETTYTDFVTALDDASKAENAGCTVKLLNDVNLSNEYDIECTEFTIDLNGKKLEHSTNNLLEVKNGDVTIIDSVGGGEIVSGWIALIASYDGYLTLGKADGTANDFTVSGKGMALMSYGARATIYGGTYEAGSNGSLYIATGMGYVQPLIGDGYALAKKDDTTSILNAKVEAITESVTVVAHTHNLVDGECACGFKSVAQIGETKYSNFVTALDDAKKEENAGCTLTLLADVELSNYYDIESKLTLDLNGKKIEREYGTAFYTENGGDLTVIDSVGGGSIVALSTAIICNHGKLTLGKADGTASDFTLNGETESLHVNTEADVTVYGGTFVAGSDASVKMYSGTAATILGEGLAFAKKDDTTSIVDGYVSILTESVTVVAHTHNLVDDECACGFKYVAQIGETKYFDFVTALDDAKKTENAGCTLNLLADVKLSAYYDIESKLTLDLNGKKIEHDDGTAFYIETGGDLTVIDSVGGGSIVGETAIRYSNGKLTLGKADGTASDFTLSGGACALYVSSNADVTVYGGTFIAGSDASVEMYSDTAATILGEGFAFAKKDDTTSFVNGYVTMLTESVTVVAHTHNFVDGECACGFKYVAQIGDTTYTDFVTALDDASKAENAGCTVKLLDDVNLSDEYDIECTEFTIDLNGKKLENSAGNLLEVSDGDVTIIDSVGGGKIVSGWIALEAYDGHLTLGKADGTANDFTVSGEGVALLSYGAYATIYGGTYEAGYYGSLNIETGYVQSLLGDGYALAKKDDTTSIVNGGVSKLTESVTVVKHTHSYVDGECACGEVKAVASIGDTKYKDFVTALDEASKAENAGCTLTLLADVKLSAYCEIESKLTLDLNGKKIERDNGTAFFIETGGDLTVIDSVGGGSIVGDPTALHCNSGKLTLGKADGTANDFTLNGETKSLYIINTDVSVYGGTYIAGSEASIKFFAGSISEKLGDGYALAKKDDTTSIVNGNATKLTESVTVVAHTHNLVDGECACGKQVSVAQVGSTEYSDITQAFNAAKNNNGVVKLLGNATVSTIYNVNSGCLTVDLNGKKLTTADDDYGIFIVNGSAKLYIIDSVGGGSIVSEKDVITTGGTNCKVTIGNENGDNNFTLQSTDSNVVSVLDSSMLTISGGTFLGSGTNNRIEVVNGVLSSTLTDDKAFVKASDTSSFIDSNKTAIAEDVAVVDHTHNIGDDGACLDCGFSFAVKIGTEYFTTLSSAMDYISNSQDALNVYIIKDIEEESVNFVEGVYTIDLKGHSITVEQDFTFDSYAHVTLIDTVGGGVLSSSHDNYGAIYMGGYDCSLTIGTSDGKNGVTVNSEKNDAIYISSGALTIYDGTFTGGYDGLFINSYVDVNLYGGTFSSIYYRFDSYGLKALKLTDILGANRAFSVDDKIVDSTDEEYYFENGEDDNKYKLWYFNSTVSVVEHTHSYVDGKCACGDLQYAAQIGTNYYTTLAEALAAAEKMTGKVELHLLKNCKLVEDLEVHAKELWIYLDGNVLYSCNSDYSRLILCDGTYNICGDGMVYLPLYGCYDSTGSEGSNATINIRGGIYDYLGYAGSDTLNIYNAEYISEVDATYYGENSINIYGGTIGNLYVSDSCVNRPILHGGKFGYISVYSDNSNEVDPYELLAEGKGYYCNDSYFRFDNGTSDNSDWIEVKDHTKHVWDSDYDYCTAGGETRYEAYVDMGDSGVINCETLEEAMELALDYVGATVYLLKDVSIDSVTWTTPSSDGLIDLNLNGHTIGGNKANTTITLKNIYFIFNAAYGGTVNTDIVINGDDNSTVVYFNSIGTYNGDILIKGTPYVVVYNGIFNGSFGFDGDSTPNIEFTCGSFKKLYAPAGYNWNSALYSGSKYYSGTPDESFTENGTEFVGFDGTQSGTYIVVAEKIDNAVAMVTVPEYGLAQAFDDFDEAISFANNYSHQYVSVQISLLNDVSISELVQLDVTDVTLYLNGHNITGSGAIQIYGYDCRICGNGNVSPYIYAVTYGKQGAVIDGGTYSSYVSVMNGAKLKINSGEFALVIVADGSECVINGGTIETLAVQSSETDLTLNGGTFKNMASSEENVDFTKFLGKGKMLVLGDAVYGTFESMEETLNGYMAGDGFITVTKGSSVVSVNVNGLVTGGFNHYEFKVEGRASKLQIVYANGSTYTLSRYSPLSTGANSKGLVSIKSYDKNGKEVNNGSADTAYEIWTVNMSLTTGTYEAKAKFDETWELGTKSFDVELETGAQVDSVTMIGTAKEGFNKYAVKVNGSAQKLQVIYFNGTTYTVNRDTLSSGANSSGVVSIKSYDKNGNVVAYGSENAEYEVWVLNMALKEGNYTIKAKCNNVWEPIGKVFKVSFSKEEAAQVRVTAAEGENGEYTFTLNGSAQKLQIVYANGSTNTFTKDNVKVTVKYYNAKNVEVDADSYDVAYETWTIKQKLPDGEYTVIAKYDNGTTYVWSKIALKFDVELSVLTAELTVATEDELLEELAKVKTTGGTVKLGGDITLSQTMTLLSYGTEESPVILDLNGNKITGNIIAEEGSFVEIQNGTLVYAGKTSPSGEYDIAAVGCVNSKLTMKNLTLNMTNSLVGIAGGDLTVEDCTINGGLNGEAFSNYTQTVGSTSTITFVDNVTVENIIFVNNMNGGAGAIFKANGTYSINGKELTPTEDYTLTEADTEISEWYVPQ